MAMTRQSLLRSGSCWQWTRTSQRTPLSLSCGARLQGLPQRRALSTRDLRWEGSGALCAWSNSKSGGQLLPSYVVDLHLARQAGDGKKSLIGV